jgi:2-amino-4-hydroxy-6-hydroxymethyldihydropteridine diphosphokinase/dihydropteroate synthase
MQTVIGLGSNIGDREKVLLRALSILRERVFRNTLRVSEFFQSEALLLPEAPAAWQIPFLNLAVRGETDLPPQKLLEVLKEIESELGRQPRGRWGPREIDLDILVYGEEHFQNADLTIPHPALLDRPFALWPLAALWPTWRSPRTRISARESALRWGLVPRNIPCRTWRVPHHQQRDFRTFLKENGMTLCTGPLPGTELVGILNLTSDSFSDGGLWDTPTAALEHALAMVDAGATVVDIGAESTRPGAKSIDPVEEQRRLQEIIPILQQVFKKLPFRPLISVDTYHATTAELACTLDVDWINDVSGGKDERLVAIVRESRACLVLMHSLSIPVSKEIVLPTGCDPIAEILKWARQHRDTLQLEPARLIFDPGIGFGKTAFQSLQILQRIPELQIDKTTWLVGHSRKSFLTPFTAAEATRRDPETAIFSALLGRNNLEYLRVHNVELNMSALGIAAVNNISDRCE